MDKQKRTKKRERKKGGLLTCMLTTYLQYIYTTVVVWIMAIIQKTVLMRSGSRESSQTPVFPFMFVALCYLDMKVKENI